MCCEVYSRIRLKPVEKRPSRPTRPKKGTDALTRKKEEAITTTATQHIDEGMTAGEGLRTDNRPFATMDSKWINVILETL